MQKPAGDNCQEYSYLYCEKCKQGFRLNRNLELLLWAKDPTLISQALTRPFLTPQSADFAEAQVCQPAAVANCALYSEAGQCLACGAGFYLEKGQCSGNPAESIPLC